jgi:DinB superfamily
VQPERRAELLTLLRDAPRRVETLLRGQPRAVLTWMPAPGKWSILEILSHLRDYELEVALVAYRRIAAGGRPIVPALDADGRALENGYRSTRPLEAIRVWKRLRREAVEILDSMDPAAWEREEPVPSPGSTTLAGIVEQHVQHDRSHASQIEANLERRSIFDRLEASRREVRAHVDNLVAESAARASSHAEICRLRDFEHGMLTRYVRILERERPAIEPLAADRPGPQDESPARVWREFDQLRGAALEFLHAIGPRLWERRGVHPHRGDLSIAELVGQHLDHDAERLAALRTLAGAATASSPEAWRFR